MAKIDLSFMLISYWQKENVRFESPVQLAAKYVSNDMYKFLPQEFKELYQNVNGTDEYDNQGFLFYRQQNLITMGKKFFLDKDSELYGIIIFADYMHENWWYGIRITEQGYEIGIIPSGKRFKPITTSLEHFVNLYMEDSEMLYDYS